MALEVGSLLNNRYLILEVIAQGGMGAIYRSQDEVLGVQVAVKENLFTTEDSSRQFQREAVILGGLRHPNLPRVTDHFVIPDQGQYLVMDYIEGEDLRQRLLRQNTISEEEALRIGISVCSALISLHSHTPPIIHRDIKPGNIKITPSGKIFLVDFGLAKVAQSGQVTTTGAQGLTPGYAPPEQYGQGTNPRSDIYALGATLYAGLTGKVPEDALSQVMGSASLTPIRAYNPRVSEKMARVIEKAMQIDQENRYTSAEDFRTALLDIKPELSSLLDQYADPGSQPLSTRSGTLATPASQPSVDFSGKTVVTPKSLQRNSTNRSRTSSGLVFLILIGSLAGLALISAGFLFLPRLLSTRTINTPQTTTPFNLNLLTPSAIASNSPQETIASPIIVSTPVIPQATSTIPVILPTSPTPPPIPSSTQPVLNLTPTLPPTPVFTPTATPLGGSVSQLAFVSERSGKPQVFIMSSSGKNLKQVTNLPDGACQPTWSPDGKQIAVTSPCPGKRDAYPGSILYIVNVDGSGVIPLPSVPGGDYDPRWSPDGLKIAFTSLRDGPPHIFILTFSDRSIVGLSSPSNRDRQPAWSPDGKLIAYETNRLGQPQIWVMSITGENAREFSILSNGYAYAPDWSPDGQTLMYTQGSGLPWLVMRQFNKQGANEVKVNEKLRPIENPKYSPDGWWIAFNSNVAGNDDIYIMNQSGADVRQLTDDPKPDYQPAWRP